MAFNNEIEKTKKEIEVLTKKLSFLEELSQTKSPAEEAYKKVYAGYPDTSTDDYGIYYDSSWKYFSVGYEAAQKDYKVGEYQEPEENEWKLVALRLGEKLSDTGPGGYYDFTPGEWFEWALNECKKEEPEEQKWDVVRESLKWHKEHPNESVEDYLTPKTPEKRKIDDLAEKLLPDDHPYKIADEHGETNPYKQGLNMIKKDKETEELMTSKGYEKNSAGFWEPKPQTHEEVSDGLKEAFREAIKQGIIPEVDKVSDEFMDEMVAKLKGQTLYDVCVKWNDDDSDPPVSDLIDRITEWLPKPQNADGSQNAYVECTVEGFNDCLDKIKRKLR